MRWNLAFIASFNLMIMIEALVLNNDNLSVDGCITYAPVYMVMFLETEDVAPIEYKVDLDGLSNSLEKM